MSVFVVDQDGNVKEDDDSSNNSYARRISENVNLEGKGGVDGLGAGVAIATAAAVGATTVGAAALAPIAVAGAVGYGAYKLIKGIKDRL